MHVDEDDDADETRLVAGYPTGRRHWTRYALRFGKGSKGNRS